MKMNRWLGGMAMWCLLASGCASPKTPASPGEAAAPAPAPAAQAGVKNAPAEDLLPPAPPEGALYTIYCAQFSGPTHAADAARARSVLVKATGLKQWYVIASEEYSTLYFGYYKTYDDAKQPAERGRAQADRLRVDSMADANGHKLFGACPFVELASPDPTAPPAWDLRNAQGYYSLEVGVYRDSPDRKKAAVEMVRLARQMGVDAYYFHGPNMSSVCVGHWPKEAIKEAEVPMVSAEDVPVILPYALNQNESAPFMVTREGQRGVPIAPQVEILDPTVKEMMDKYSVHAINGVSVIMRAKDKAGKEYTQEAPSFLVKIPHEEANPNIDDSPAPAPSVDAEAAGQQQPNPPSDTGRLKSIGP